ncbi:DUF6933 domain-containing protein [Methylomonas koyamae]|uniref:DUF6933 domain-containing protein n=1 Tax=Methylomonas koyamae TaxID=702114 RepID=UPI002873C33D|nr:hypothetical protein [Methylomonas koyamae]WNB75368.1 hypothetical protein RI210_19130 [Methylomonas koyamae]
MINIHATKKLYAKLPAPISAPQSETTPLTPTLSLGEREQNPLSGWHANLLILQRRNCLLLVHDATRFPLFVKGLLKADFANFDHLFADALMNTLLKLGASQSQLDTAAALLAPCRFDTACDRSVQGTMNQMAGDLEHRLWFDNARLDDLSSYATGAWLSDRPCTVKGQKDCIWPNRAMLALLSRAGNSAPAKRNVIQLADYLSSRNG